VVKAANTAERVRAVIGIASRESVLVTRIEACAPGRDERPCSHRGQPRRRFVGRDTGTLACRDSGSGIRDPEVGDRHDPVRVVEGIDVLSPAGKGECGDVRLSSLIAAASKAQIAAMPFP
jgi:hypothetical protein